MASISPSLEKVIIDSKNDTAEENNAFPKADTDDAGLEKESLSAPADHGSETPSVAAVHEMSPPSKPRDSTSEPASERPSEPTGTAGEDFSVLTLTQRRLVVLTASLAALFSPMATAIYCETPS